MTTPNQSERDPMFDALRADMDTLNTPHGVEKALLQAFARNFPPKRPWYRLPARAWALGGGLTAAALALVLALGLPALQAPGGAPADRGQLIARADDGGLFIALDSVERIEREPAPRMVETEMSRSSLAALGVPLTPENAGDAVKAELLVGGDGQALAVRLSTVSDSRTITN